VSKSFKVEGLLNEVAKEAFGRNRKTSFEKGICVDCGQPVNFNFRNDISAKEYEISGLCQECQDSIFGED
jgi:hypothetical protein